MKTYVVITFLMLAGCSQQQESITPTPPKVDEVPLLLSAKSQSIVSKGDDAPLPQDVTAGIYVTVKNSLITTAQWANYKHKSDATGALLSDMSINIIQTKSYDIYAYSLYQSAITNVSSVVFNHGVDVLWAPKSTLDYVAPTNHTVALNFTHCMSQITFNVVLKGIGTGTPFSNCIIY